MNQNQGDSTDGLSGPGCGGERCPAPPLESRADSRRGLWIAMILTFVVMFAELIGGLVSNSLALLADAGHMLTDVAVRAHIVTEQGLAADPIRVG